MIPVRFRTPSLLRGGSLLHGVLLLPQLGSLRTPLANGLLGGFEVELSKAGQLRGGGALRQLDRPLKCARHSLFPIPVQEATRTKKVRPFEFGKVLRAVV